MSCVVYKAVWRGKFFKSSILFFQFTKTVFYKSDMVTFFNYSFEKANNPQYRDYVFAVIFILFMSLFEQLTYEYIQLLDTTRILGIKLSIFLRSMISSEFPLHCIFILFFVGLVCRQTSSLAKRARII